MVRLDRDAGATGEADAFDHVGIERALRQEIRPADLCGLFLKHGDEFAANELALLFRVGEASQAAQKAILRIHMDQFDAIMFAEQGNDLLGLAQPHQAMVDEHACQLVADRFVDQHRRDGAVDTAGQAANHPARANLRANIGDLGRAKLRHGPVARQAADMTDEIGEQLAAIGGMDDFGMELGRIKAPGFVGGDGEGRTLAGGDDLKAVGQLRHLVAMAHPHLMLFARRPKTVEQSAGLFHLDEGAAKLAALPAFDIAAQLLHHRLLTIADAQHRNARVEYRLRCAGTVIPHD